MAAPIVSHIAALIRSYFPSLSAADVKKIIMQSVWKPNDISSEYPIPQKEESKTLSQIAASGGIVNAANAVNLASTLNVVNIKKNKSK
jgi:hypothetical protein